MDLFARLAAQAHEPPILRLRSRTAEAHTEPQGANELVASTATTDRTSVVPAPAKRTVRVITAAATPALAVRKTSLSETAPAGIAPQFAARRAGAAPPDPTPGHLPAEPLHDVGPVDEAQADQLLREPIADASEAPTSREALSTMEIRAPDAPVRPIRPGEPLGESITPEPETRDRGTLSHQQGPSARESGAPPEIVVHIGRIEVRAATTPRREPAARSQPKLTLEQYLDARHGPTS